MTVMSPEPVVQPQAAEVPPSGWRHLTHRPLPLVCIAIVALYTLVGLLSYTPLLDRKITQSVGDSYDRPALLGMGNARLSSAHESSPLERLMGFLDRSLGTDVQGRSVFWRLLYGSRVALTITVCTSVLSLSIGVTLGVLAGFYGGWIDELVTWLFTTVNAIPWILLVVAFVYVFKQRTVFGHEVPQLAIIILALGLTDWVGICRLIRAEVLKHRDRDYVYAARAVGLGDARILFFHILPNVLHLVIITFTLGAVGYVQAEVALTFLGLGISEQPSWGRMIDDARLELLHGVWWQLAVATIAITVISLALSLLGDALRDALDPKLRGTD